MSATLTNISRESRTGESDWQARVGIPASNSAGILRGDGTFEPTVPVRDRPDGMSIGVGIPTRVAIVSG
jgi:hypothetical protein